MQNPFSDKYTGNEEDVVLIENAVSGDKVSLENLIRKHQDWVYNVALRMVYSPEDAKDVTQEVLVKVITKLSTFRKESSFRTWLYRIVFNYILNLRRVNAEQSRLTDFNSYGEAIDSCPDNEFPSTFGFKASEIIEEVKLSCMFGMLLCLSREQRLVFVLGSLFGVTDAVGAELLEISKENFRKKLSRARKDMFSFMNNRCGLMKKSNPCMCSKKASALIDSGFVNPDNLVFNRDYVSTVRELAPYTLSKYDDFISEKGNKLFSEQPFRKSPDFVIYIRGLIDSNSFREIFKFN